MCVFKRDHTIRCWINSSVTLSQFACGDVKRGSIPPRLVTRGSQILCYTFFQQHTWNISSGHNVSQNSWVNVILIMRRMIRGQNFSQNAHRFLAALVNWWRCSAKFYARTVRPDFFDLKLFVNRTGQIVH